MTRSYMKSRVLEALEKNKGDAAQAQRQLLQQAKDDPRLLLEIAEPHLRGIIAYAIDWVARSEDTDTAAPAREVSVAELDAMGAALAESIAGNSGDKFGTQGTGLAGKPGKASEQHVEAIQKIAGKSKKD